MFAENYLYLLIFLVIGIVILIIYIKKKGDLSIFTKTKRKNELQNISQKPVIIKDQNKDNIINLDPIDKDHTLPLKDSVSSDISSSVSDIPNFQKDIAIDTKRIVEILERTIQERPYLKQEDKQVLRFLAEKEGTAFESEIRNKFILPKTTLWRLIRRLEREDLVEVRKAGIQNLIKLRYEDFSNTQST